MYVGIDQHRKQLTVNVRDESGNVILRRQVSTEWKKIRAFFDEVRDLAQAHAGYMSVVEICGFNDWLLKLLPEHGCRETIIVQPGEQSTQKTDRRDVSQRTRFNRMARFDSPFPLPRHGGYLCSCQFRIRVFF